MFETAALFPREQASGHHAALAVACCDPHTENRLSRFDRPRSIMIPWLAACMIVASSSHSRSNTLSLWLSQSGRTLTQREHITDCRRHLLKHLVQSGDDHIRHQPAQGRDGLVVKGRTLLLGTLPAMNGQLPKLV